MSRNVGQWFDYLVMPASIVLGILFIIAGAPDSLNAGGLTIAGAILVGAAMIARTIDKKTPLDR